MWYLFLFPHVSKDLPMNVSIQGLNNFIGWINRDHQNINNFSSSPNPHWHHSHHHGFQCLQPQVQRRALLSVQPLGLLQGQTSPAAGEEWQTQLAQYVLCISFPNIDARERYVNPSKFEESQTDIYWIIKWNHTDPYYACMAHIPFKHEPFEVVVISGCGSTSFS